MWVVHQASIGLRDEDDTAAVAVAPVAVAADGSFAESARFEASKLVVVFGKISIAMSALSCRIRIGKGNSVDLTAACLDNPL